MLEAVKVAEHSLRVTHDDSNDVYTGVGVEIVAAGSLMRNAVPPLSILFEFRFLLE